MEKRVKWKVFLVTLLLVFLVSLVGSLFASENTNSQWYLNNRPSFTPPNWVFGPVWTILYFLIALSLYFSWIKAKPNGKKKLITAFSINLFANALWSYLFFGIKNPLLAFIDIVIIFCSIVAMIAITIKIDKKAGWVLLPYLLWVVFASILNLTFLIQ